MARCGEERRGEERTVRGRTPLRITAAQRQEHTDVCHQVTRESKNWTEGACLPPPLTYTFTLLASFLSVLLQLLRSTKQFLSMSVICPLRSVLDFILSSLLPQFFGLDMALADYIRRSSFIYESVNSSIIRMPILRFPKSLDLFDIN